MAAPPHCVCSALRIAACIAIATSACRGEQTHSQPAVADRQPTEWHLEQRITLTAPDGINGLSGLTRSDDGRLWSVAERAATIVELSASGDRVRVHAIDPPAGVGDLEAIAWLGQRRFALGTEGGEPSRASDPVVVIDLDDPGATRVIPLPYALWHLSPRENQGIEGLCHAGGRLVAGLETVAIHDGTRRAPVGVYDTERSAWVPFWLELTSDTGKLSSLDCRAVGTGLELIAIERHYDVTRLLHFELPAAATGSQPTVAAPSRAEDLRFRDKDDNFEGTAWLSPGRVALVVDNQHRTITGPNQLLIVSGPVAHAAQSARRPERSR